MQYLYAYSTRGSRDGEAEDVGRVFGLFLKPR